MEKRLLEEKEESPAKKLKMETKATEEEEEVDNRSTEISLEEKVKVKKAQNVREKLAEMKNVYVAEMEEDAEDDDDDEVEDITEEGDVVIEKATLSEDSKTPSETNCQVSSLL